MYSHAIVIARDVIVVGSGPAQQFPVIELERLRAYWRETRGEHGQAVSLTEIAQEPEHLRD